MARTFIRSSDLASGSIIASLIAADAVETAKIKDLNVTTGKLADGAATEAKLASNAVTEAKLASGAVTAAKIGAGAVESAKLADGAVIEAKLGAGAVTSGKLADGAVTEAKIGAGAITAAKIGSGAVESAKLADGSVIEAKIGSGAVTADKIGAGAVTSAKLASASVGTAAIIDANVTTDKLAANAVSPGKADLTAEWTFSAGKLKTSMAASPADSDVVTKGYLDSFAQGVNWKESVRAAQSNANFDPSTIIAGALFGGVTVADKDRVLWFSTSGAHTLAGVYVVGVSGSTRAPDFDAPNEIRGSAVFVREGTFADSGWICTTDGTITLGTTGLVFTQFTGLGQVTAGNGLTKTGNTLDVSVSASGGIEIVSDALKLKLNASNPGLAADSNGLTVARKANGGVGADANGIFVNTANGIQVDGGGFVSVKLNASNPALVADGAGLAVQVDGSDAIEATGTGLKLKGASITTAKLGDGAVTLAKLAPEVTAAIGKADHGMTFIASANQTTFDLAHGDVDSSFGGHMAYLNGRLQLLGAGNDYTFSNGTGTGGVDQIVFTFQLAADDFVAIVYGRA
jgi:hypothetical protein